MKIRNQLLLAFFLLAVVPLAGLVLSSYLSSSRAFHQAVDAENADLTSEMGHRLKRAKEDVRRSLGFLAQMPLPDLLQKFQRHDAEVRAEISRALGEEAAFLESIELEVPVPPLPPEPGANPFGEEVESSEHGGGEPGSRSVFVIRLDDSDEVRIEAEGEEGSAGGEPRAILIERRVEEEEHPMPEARRLANELGVPLMMDQKWVGELRPQISRGMLTRRVLDSTRTQQGEIPFAVDTDGQLYVGPGGSRSLLESLAPDAEALGRGELLPDAADRWAIGTQKDEETCLTFGVARPIGQPLADMRRAALHNLGTGLGLVTLALLGILPLSRRMTRRLDELTKCANQIARGELDAHVPVRSGNEFGQLAKTFNHMAEEIKERRRQLVEEERLRQEREVEGKLLKAEVERTTIELEEARRFQLSLLPKTLPDVPRLDIAVHTQTATEVGGDYYDFYLSDKGHLTVAVGDATGHGARAGTMVAVVKSLFSTRVPGVCPAAFLTKANTALKGMDLDRMAMSLQLARFEDERLLVSSAGIPPLLRYCADSGEVEEVAVAGMPLGGLACFEYQEREVPLRSGDTLLLTTDGFPELIGREGEPFGYDAVCEAFAECADQPAEEVVRCLSATAREWIGGDTPEDDVTFVVVKVR